MSKEYFKTDSKTVDFNDSAFVTEMYAKGYVLTRLGKGVMNQTRSLRIDLSKFELSSENRRVLNKTEELMRTFATLPLAHYSWEIHKLGKEFYSKKFGEGTMSAAKIKEMFTGAAQSNMNAVFKYELRNTKSETISKFEIRNSKLGYALCYANTDILHYAYPFYDLEVDAPNLGLGMMLKAILWAKENNKKYIYLGSIVDSTSKYKLQFEGLEWFDESTKAWSTDLEKVKELIKN